MKKTLILITALATIIYGCAKEEEFVYDASSVVPVVQGFSGPSAASANNVTEYEYGVNPRGGSSYNFSLVGATALTLTPVEGKSHKATIVYKESPVDLDAFVIVVETASNGKVSEPDSVAVTVSAYCSYNAQSLIGTLPGIDGRNGADYASQALVSAAGSDELFGVTGLAFEWMVDYWGETITNSEVVEMQLDPLGLFITIPDQYYMSTLWNGDPYDYSISGSGLVHACTNEITITYNLSGVSGDFVATVAFP